jgi:hypothetical protein
MVRRLSFTVILLILCIFLFFSIIIKVDGVNLK